MQGAKFSQVVNYHIDWSVNLPDLAPLVQMLCETPVKLVKTGPPIVRHHAPVGGVRRGKAVQVDISMILG